MDVRNYLQTTWKRVRGNATARRPIFLDCYELEPRVLYSAAPVDPALLDPAHDPGTGPDEGWHALDPGHDMLQTMAPEWLPLASADAPSPEQPMRHELVLINSDVQDRDALLSQIPRDAGTQLEIVVLDQSRDNFDTVTELLSRSQDVDAVHFITHGSEGRVRLGTETVDLVDLVSRADALARWGEALNPDADLLFYGCRLAGSSDGEAWVQTLADLTGLDVAASDNLTGAAALGGDWALEFHSGAIESQVLFDHASDSQWLSTLGTFTVTTTADSGVGSLRWAIDQANANPGFDTIDFSLAGGVQTISIGGQLPNITETVLIDGWSKSDFAGTPLIEIRGDGAGSNNDGIVIDANDVEIRGLMITRMQDGDAIVINGNSNWIHGVFVGVDEDGDGGGDGNHGHGIEITGANNTIGGTGAWDRNVISDNDDYGIYINGAAADNNAIVGNHIGVNLAGSADLGNGKNGIRINDGDSNRIGGATPGEGNVISGNDWSGIYLENNAGLNTIQGNMIGVNAAGTGAIGNGYAGVYLSDSPDNLVGGDSPAARNIISGNLNDGISVVGSGSTGNTIQGNWIGLNGVGTGSIGNAVNGIWVANGASNNLIGGSTSGAGNVVVANLDDGIEIQGSTSTGNRIFGNIVGLDPTGLVVMGNGDGVDEKFDAGIVIEDAPANQIGGPGAFEGNLISGNLGQGILIGGPNADFNVVRNNMIGLKADGTAAGNTRHGIRIKDNVEGTSGTGSEGTIIGGTNPGEGNTIAFNSRDGINVATGEGHTIRGNRIWGNGEEAIDLGNDGITSNDANDADSGDNRLTNFPVLTTAWTNTDQLRILGTLDGEYGSSSYGVDFFWTLSPDPGGHGGAENYIGSTSFTTDASGDASFDLVVNGTVPTGSLVTAVVTDPFGNSSELSLNVAVQEMLNIDLPGPQVNWTEGDGVVFVDPGAVLNNPQGVGWDGGNLTVNWTAGGTSFDQLSIFAPGTTGNLGIQGGSNLRYHPGGTPVSFGTIISDGSNGAPLVVQFNSNATDVMVDRLLESIQFENTQIAPPDSVRTIQFLLTDTGGDTSNAETELIHVGPSNAAPTVAVAGGWIGYNENDPTTVIDSALTVSDPDSPNLAAATVQITSGFASGQDWLDWDTTLATSLGISANYDSGTGTLTFSGNQSLANYQSVLQSVGYRNSSDDPNVTNRVVTFTIDDGFDTDSDSRQVRLTAFNDPPVLDLDLDDSAATGLDFRTSYFPQGSPAGLVDTDVTLTDPDHTTLQSLTVSIVGGFVSTEDVLYYDTVSGTSWGLVHFYNPLTGTLTISGTTSVANYLTLLNSIEYDNLSATPSIAPRTIEFAVDDGIASGALARTTVNIVSATGILLSTDSVLTPTGTATLSGWEDEDILELSDPGLMLQPAGDTAGTISLFQDMTPFTGKNITAMHFVGRDITIGGGANTVQLQYGDILFALKTQDVFNGNTAWSDDLVRFRPSDSSFEAVAEKLRLRNTVSLGLLDIPLKKIEKEQVKNRVPENIFHHFSVFYYCPHCQRIYWEGGHVKRLINKLNRMGVPISKQKESSK